MYLVQCNALVVPCVHFLTCFVCTGCHSVPLSFTASDSYLRGSATWVPLLIRHVVVVVNEAIVCMPGVVKVFVVVNALLCQQGFHVAAATRHCWQDGRQLARVQGAGLKPSPSPIQGQEITLTNDLAAKPRSGCLHSLFLITLPPSRPEGEPIHRCSNR
jgi:hypothetical protein